MRHLQKSVCECVPAFVCGHEGIATVFEDISILSLRIKASQSGLGQGLQFAYHSS